MLAFILPDRYNADCFFSSAYFQESLRDIHNAGKFAPLSPNNICNCNCSTAHSILMYKL